MNKRDEISEIILIGISYKTAPIEIREKFSINNDKIQEFQDRMKKNGIDEIVYLSTCNRVEIYFTAKDVYNSITAIYKLLEEYTNLNQEIITKYIYKKYSRDAVLHLLSVASSLDSMVIGENEILSQIKQAYRDSVYHKNSGILLNRLFHQAFNTAKKVRTDTEISQNPLSIAYIAVEKAKQVFCHDDFSNKKALLIGAGEMAELILKYFTKYNVKNITIANRTIHNAEKLVDTINKEAHIIPLEDIEVNVADIDIIISSITCHDYILTSNMIKDILEKRDGKPLFLIDIAVPRNIDPDIACIKNVHLFNIDDLKKIADENLKNRLNEVEVAKQIVNQDATELLEWYEGLEIVPMIIKIQKSFDDVREKEVEKYRRKKLKHLSDNDFEIVDELTKQIMSKILHNPIMAIKENKTSKVDGYHDRDSIKQKVKIIEELFK